MSGECETCGEHCLECTCKQGRPSLITGKWISAEESPPKAGSRVLTCDEEGWIEIMNYMGYSRGMHHWFCPIQADRMVIYWMELPCAANDREGGELLALLKLIIQTIEAQEFPNEARSFVIDSIIFAQTDSKSKDCKPDHNPEGP